MSSEKNAKDLLTFFSYVCLDDKQALEIAGKCFFQMKNNPQLKLVGASYKQVQKLKKIHKYTLPQKSHWNGTVSDLVRQRWIKFYDRSTVDELCAYLWVFVLEITLSEVAQALGVSEGVVLSRLSRATQKMSEILSTGILETGEV